MSTELIPFSFPLKYFLKPFMIEAIVISLPSGHCELRQAVTALATQ